MVLHGLNRIFQKPTPNLSSSDRTNQLRSKTVYAGTVELSINLNKPGNDRYKTYNGPYEIAKKMYTEMQHWSLAPVTRICSILQKERCF